MPKIMPAMAAMTPEAGQAMAKGTPWPAMNAVEYAPTARKAALPSEICPVKPVRMLRPIAAITAMAARLATSSQ